MKADEVLEKAAKLIVEPGVWTRFRYGEVTASGKLLEACAVGATVYAAIGEVYCEGWAAYSTPVPALNDALLVLHKQTGERGVPHWNDEIVRTADDVAQAMIDAAAEWRIAQERES